MGRLHPQPYPPHQARVSEATAGWGLWGPLRAAGPTPGHKKPGAAWGGGTVREVTWPLRGIPGREKALPSPGQRALLAQRGRRPQGGSPVQEGGTVPRPLPTSPSLKI